MPPEPRPPARQRGFTLVEVAAVTLVLAVLAAGVALSFAGPLRSMRAGDAVERVRAFDATARLAARRSGRPVEMRFGDPPGTLTRTDDPDARGGPVAYRGGLPGGYRVDRILRASDGGSDDDAASDGGRRAAVRCSPAGLTRSYAVRVVGPGLDRWLVFAGLTGQVIEARDETDVEAIFDAARRRRSPRG